MWWIFMGVALLLLLASLIFLGVRALTSGLNKSMAPEEIWLPEYVSPDPDDYYDDYEYGDDWNQDGWTLGADYLYGEWVSDVDEHGEAEALYFGDDGYVEIWNAVPGAGDTLDTWYSGSWQKSIISAGYYWTEDDYLTLDFEEADGPVTFYVEMTGLYDIVIYSDDGDFIHFEQVSW